MSTILLSLWFYHDYPCNSVDCTCLTGLKPMLETVKLSRLNLPHAIIHIRTNVHYLHKWAMGTEIQK